VPLLHLPQQLLGLAWIVPLLDHLLDARDLGAHTQFAVNDELLDVGELFLPGAHEWHHAPVRALT
jgi:hypothetical protein